MTEGSYPIECALNSEIRDVNPEISGRGGRTICLEEEHFGCPGVSHAALDQDELVDYWETHPPYPENPKPEAQSFAFF